MWTANITHSLDSNLLREAQSHFERALILDPSNVVATAVLNKLPNIVQGYTSPASADHDSDEDNMDVGDSPPVPRKRIRM